MCHLITIGGHAHRIVRAVKKLREDFAKPSRIEDVAREIGMSASEFHAHFKAVTALSPLQFQKRLRLQEARRLMLTESLDAAEAGFQVGYDGASHFSREYCDTSAILRSATSEQQRSGTIFWPRHS
jgi:AraC-like DNA-binding protein